MTKQALIELRDKVAAGELGAGKWTPKELMLMQRALGPCPENARKAIEGSLDAAFAFLEAVLPEGEWIIRTNFDAENEPRFFANVWTGESPNRGGECFPVYADTPARALLLATLEALISGKSDGVK